MISKRTGIFKNNFSSMSVFDYISLGILLVFCFVSYNHADILHTAGSSFGLLNGHVLDFYEYNADYLGGNSYMITTYIIFALWNIPLRLFRLVTVPTMSVPVFARIWYKILTTLFYFGTGYSIKLICKELHTDDRTASLAMFLFISNPIGVYSQFIFGQYDVITTFFMTLGLYYYVKRQTWKFILFFGIAITCKYFALLFFLPLLLCWEKKIWKILIKMVAGGALFLLECLIYLPSEKFRSGVFGFGAVGYIFDTKLSAGHVDISLCIVAFLVICGISYFIVIEGENINKWGIYLLNLVSYICFGLSFWHPQWLLMAVPIWTLGTVLSKDREVYFMLDVLLMGFYTVFTVVFWCGGLDSNLFRLGFFESMFHLDFINQNYTMKDLFHVNDRNLMYTCFSGTLLVYTLFKHPQNLTADKWACKKGIVRFRYLVGIAIFVIPSLVCVYINYTKPMEIFYGGGPYDFFSAMPNEIVYEQKVELEDVKITAIQIYSGTYGRENDCLFHVDFVDDLTKEKVVELLMEGEQVKDCDFTQLDFAEPLNVKGKGVYTIQIYCTGVLPNCSNSVAIARTAAGVIPVLIDGEESEDSVSFKLFGMKR